VNDADGNNTDAAGLSQLAFDASTGGVSNLTQTIAPRDAKIAIDGIAVTSPTNQISSAIEGLTLNLTQAEPGTVATVSVARDVSTPMAALNGFVKAYNDASTTLATLSAYDPSTRTGAVLQGDATLIMVQSQLRSTLSSAVANAGGYASLSE